MEPRTLALPRPLPGWGSPLGTLLGWRRAWLGMDANPRALAFAQTRRGALLLHVAFLAILAKCWFETEHLAIIALALAGCFLLPGRRLQVVGLAGLVAMLGRPILWRDDLAISTGLFAEAGVAGVPPELQISAVAALFLLVGWGALSLQERFRGNRLGRRPLVAQFLVLAGLCAAAATLPLAPGASAALWTFIAVYVSSFWFLAYAFANLKTRDPASPTSHAGYLRPFWQVELAPIGKGMAFLRKFEAKDEIALAATRLKAVKLLVWGFILQKGNARLDAFLTGEAGVPQLRDALLAQAQGAVIDPATGWAILLADYVTKVVSLAAIGHIVIAIVRMAGFGIPRNTVKPFASRSLAEFWNRYYYYFKEILVDFFFFPAFTRFFKKHPRLRVAFATFCAAGVGNVLYHFIYLVPDLRSTGFLDLVHGFLTYLIYATALAAGIILSQLNKAKPKPEDGFLRYEVLPRLNVTLFFCALMVFDDIKPGIALSTRFDYLFNLVGA